jgi:hypothetical protein
MQQLEGFCFLSLQALLSLPSFPCFQSVAHSGLLRSCGRRDVDPSNTSSCIRSDCVTLTRCDAPLLVLFVSHRWEAAAEPDPECTQVQALQALARNVKELFLALLTTECTERLRHVPSLLVHGTLQASIVLSYIDWGQLLSTASTTSISGATSSTASKAGDIGEAATIANSDIEPERLAESLLERILVWYDYSCIPQAPRKSDAEFQLFRRTLAHLHMLITDKHTLLLALRHNDDDYHSRGWCVAEANLAFDGGTMHETTQLATKHLRHEPLLLRSDLVGQPMELRTADVGAHQAFERWQTASASSMEVWCPIASLCPYYQAMFEAGVDDTPTTPVLCLTRHTEWSRVYSGMIAVIVAASVSKRQLDLAAELRALMDRSGLACTNQSDIVQAGLLILIGYSGGRLKHLWLPLLNRQLEQHSLIAIVRLREPKRAVVGNWIDMSFSIMIDNAEHIVLDFETPRQSSMLVEK